jgi:hypothetical protein
MDVLEMSGEEFLEFARKENWLYIGSQSELREFLVKAQEDPEIDITVYESIKWTDTGKYGEEGDLMAWDLQPW